MQEVVKNLLALREYAISKNAKCAIYMHMEDSHFVRLANSGISLITSEKLNRLDVECFDGKKVASSSMILNADDLEGMKGLVDNAVKMTEHVSALSYTPSFPVFSKTTVEEGGYDSRLHNMENSAILDYVKVASEGLENDDIVLSGNFTKGETVLISMSTETEHYALWRNSDAQISFVLSSNKNKWEINAEQSANRLEDLNPEKINRRLKLLKSFYNSQSGEKVPEGKYKLVLGPAAIAEYLSFLASRASMGAVLKQGGSIFKAEDVGKKVLSDMVTITDDPNCYQAYAQKIDAYGIERKPFKFFEKGVHGGFVWHQQAADEYNEKSSGINLNNVSLVMQGGDKNVNNLEELLNMERDCDILYVPYLHYTGLVNPSEGLVTGTTRFGALLLKKNGDVVCPFNVRITEKVGDIFGKKLVWVSKNTEAYNASSSYGRRSPDACVVPSLMMIDDVSLELNNTSY